MGPQLEPYLQLARLKHEGQPLVEFYDHEEVALGYMITRAAVEWRVWERALAAPHVWIPKWIPKPLELVAAAAALVLIENPIVTRRLWAGWRRSAKVGADS
jgi:hypothetical protein